MITIRKFQDTDADLAAVAYFESFKTYLKEPMETDAPRPREYRLSACRHSHNGDYENMLRHTYFGGIVDMDPVLFMRCMKITARDEYE